MIIMEELITKDEVDILRRNIHIVRDRISIYGKNNLSTMYTKSGYGIMLTRQSDLDNEGIVLEFMSISYKKNEVDFASLDVIAYSVLGEGYAFGGSLIGENDISDVKIYHYFKMVSGDKARFKNFIEFFRKLPDVLIR